MYACISFVPTLLHSFFQNLVLKMFVFMMTNPYCSINSSSFPSLKPEGINLFIYSLVYRQFLHSVHDKLHKTVTVQFLCRVHQMILKVTKIAYFNLLTWLYTLIVAVCMSWIQNYFKLLSCESYQIFQF